METLLQDLRYAFRTLRRSPGFSVVAVATLALGVGATTAIYTLLEAVVLSPLPYADAERLVKIENRVPGLEPGATWELSPAGYFYYRENSRTLEGIGVYQTADLSVTGEAPAERVRVAMATPSVFDMLRARPALGRLISAEDARPRASEGSVRPGPAEPVVVLSHDFWVRRFGAEPSVVGRTIEVSGDVLPVVGVLEPGFELPDQDVDLWMAQGLNPDGPATSWHQFLGIGRLAAGATVAEAQAELARFTKQRFPEAFPNVYDESMMRELGFAVDVHTLQEDIVGPVAGRLWILLGAVGLVLVIACANVANLFLVRGEARRREIAIRSALGAQRARLGRRYLTESMVLALIAGGVAVGIAAAGLGVVLAFSPSWIPRLDAVGLSWESVAFAFGVSVAAGVVLGLVPLLRTRGELGLLEAGGRGLTPSRRQHAFRSLLVIAQMALALVLLASAGLMLRSFFRLRGVDPGLDPTNVLTMELALPSGGYRTHEAVSAFYHETATRVGALPGVRTVGMSTTLPLTSEGGCGDAVFIEDRPPVPGQEPPHACTRRTAPGYFEALGIDVRGRTPTWDDVQRQSGAVVVSRALADRLWPGEDPIGKGIRPNGWREPFYRVVGVAEGVRAHGLDQPPTPVVHFPVLLIEGTRGWSPPYGMSLLVKAETTDPQLLTTAIRRTVAEIDPDVPIANVQTMERVFERSMARVSFTMILLAIAAVMAVLLSAIGIYGVIAYVVGQRTAEIGIRMAFGARHGQIAGMVVRQAATLALAGVGIGIVAALAVVRVLRTLLFEVSPTDPLTLVSVSMLLVGVVIVASWLPARRAAAVDPVVALRAE